MKGLAPSDTLTGKVQRVLTDEWKKLGKVAVDAREARGGTRLGTIQACLERLVSEGRAEARFVHSPHYMSGGYTEYRRKQ